MNLQYRVDLLVRLGKYILANDTAWQEAKERAGFENGWFISEFVELSTNNIARRFLQEDIIKKWIARYELPETNTAVKTVGIVMAGNIPLVGFHDLLCTFISGHRAAVKTSSKDDVLIKHLVATLAGWDESVNDFISFAPMLKGCDAYIATGSNNSSGYFEYYFGKFKHIIRRNRTSVAVLRGNETRDVLGKLADDVFQFFGLGCRNVTKLYVPKEYDFISLIQAFKKYDYLADH